MKDKFLEQKEVLTSLKHEISLLQQQIDYLLRNERALGLLDLDVMMNRTHTVYDRLCSINLAEDEDAQQEVEVDPTMLNALFGLSETPAQAKTETAGEEMVPEEVPVQEERIPVEEPVPVVEEFVPEPEPERIDFDFNLMAEDPEVVELEPEAEPEIEHEPEIAPEPVIESEPVAEPEPEPEP